MKLLKEIKTILFFCFYVLFTPFIGFELLFHYVLHLAENNSKVAVITIFKSFNIYTVYSLFMSALISALIFLVPLWYANQFKKTYKYYAGISNVLKKFALALFILLFSSFGLTELQFSFFCAFISFIALITTLIFKD